jgi:hypothetical protein
VRGENGVFLQSSGAGYCPWKHNGVSKPRFALGAVYTDISPRRLVTVRGEPFLDHESPFRQAPLKSNQGGFQTYLGVLM